ECRLLAAHCERIDIVFYGWSGFWRQHVDPQKIAAVPLATLIVFGVAPTSFQRVRAKLGSRDNCAFAQRAQCLSDRGPRNPDAWPIERTADVKADYVARCEIDNHGSGRVSDSRAVVCQKTIVG